MPYLSARPRASPAVAILGVPFDATSTFRAGSRYGPEAIRWASQSIESYSPILERDLEVIALSDLGDIDVTRLSCEDVVRAIITRLQEIPPSTLPVVLGGEHTVTLGAIRACAARHPDLVVLQLDAHADLRDEYEGERISHATVMRRILDETGMGTIVQLGIRAGTREEFELAARASRYMSHQLKLPSAVWSWLDQRPVYVTIDIDVLDPSEAPGTGNPEPEGVTGWELLTFVRRLGLLRVIGLDVVEVSPPHDPSGRTAVLAATIIREAILALSQGRES